LSPTTGALAFSEPGFIDLTLMDICLIVLYNHNYERNIPIVKRIYKGRFSHVYQVMPFYRGSDPEVICVYESSFQFNGYLSQAIKKLPVKKFTHILVVADDMVLNPVLNESNIVEYLRIGYDACFITNIEPLTEKRVLDWTYGISTITHFNANDNSCEWRKQLPPIDKARACFDKMGCNWRECISVRMLNWLKYFVYGTRSNPWHQRFLPPRWFFKRLLHITNKVNLNELRLDTGKLTYPIAYGFSDFLVVPTQYIDDFCHYSGVLAATNTFVECAIPTALILSCAKVVTCTSAGLKCETGILDYAVRAQLEIDNELSYKKLLDGFPDGYLYIHPIKLSRWKDFP